MVEGLESYNDLIEETLRKFDFKLPINLYAIAFHKIYVDGSGLASDYEIDKVDDNFLQFMNVSLSQISNLHYESLFPETKETKFDWVGTLGQAAISNGRAKFYCFSGVLNKWFSVFAFGHKKGYAFLIFEDISNAKALEIQENLKKSNSSALKEE